MVKATSSLQQNDFNKQDRVALMLPNCPQYVISYYGTLQAGGIVTQVNLRLVGKELQHILTDSGAETIVIYEPLLAVLNQIIDNTSVKHVVKVNLAGRETEDSIVIGFSEFLQQATSPPESVEINPVEDIAILQ